MPSTYSTRLRVEKQADGENSNTWGSRCNSHTFDMFDEAFGVQAVTLSTSHTLTTANGSTDEARNMGLVLSGTGGTLTIPDLEKCYLVDNGCSTAATITTGSGTTASVGAGEIQWVYSTGSAAVYASSWAPQTSPTFATSITGSYLTASELLASDASKNIVSLDTATYPSLTELAYVKGVTSAIQTQLDGKAATGDVTAGDLTMSTARILGRTTASTGAIEELSGTDVTAMLDDFTSSLSGLAPASSGGTTNFLRADGNWAAPAGAGDMVTTNNLADVASAPTSLSNLIGSFSSNGLKVVRVNSGATDLEYAALASTDLSDTASIALLTSSQTLTNKTIALGSNTISGTTAQFNTALSDGSFATLAGTETLTDKTIALGSNTVSGTTAQFNTALTDGSFATLAGTETLTNKTFSLGSNTVSGTTAQFNTALSDGSFATLAGAETLTNKRQQRRISTSATETSPFAWNGDSYDDIVITAQTTALTLNADAGTPVDGECKLFVLGDNGTSRVFTFTGGASKAFADPIALLTVSGSNFTYTTTANKRAWIGTRYNGNTSRWEVLALQEEA